MLGLSWTSFRARALPVLTTTAHATAPFLTIFLAVHLSAPALANVGGASLASQTLLLGREYYQTALGEPLLLFAPLAVHALSGILKRILSLIPSSQPAPKQRPASSPLTLSAITLGLLLPTHVLTHRVFPALPTPPILSVGPAELDFAFVQTALRTWPWRSGLMYAALAVAGVVHAVEGATLLKTLYWKKSTRDTAKVEAELQATSTPKRSSGLHPRTKRIALALTLGALPVLTGLYALAIEPTFIFKDLAARYRAAFLESPVYRIL
ncbi:hypothetical protein BDN70DRAFT_871948 [Pholiota conissans]|uniref:Mitochondrial adapter protein MCP1 transmembrane domain-containing protein n=1 Tax=Pholiota conissans TaxID=109636 RepID=A0A9P5ZBD9_9AGAR|nr:hypothetical protein BDN70DRAFT_871948 [Pholiota conissans]